MKRSSIKSLGRSVVNSLRKREGLHKIFLLRNSLVPRSDSLAAKISYNPSLFSGNEYNEHMLENLRDDVKRISFPDRAKEVARFFKTGVGEYGEGDVFAGLTVPQCRSIAVKYKGLPLTDVKKLLASEVHEERLIALLLLVHNFNRGDAQTKKEIYEFYLAHTKHINNWDLVDLSADKIIGEYLWECVLASGAKQSHEIATSSSSPCNDVLTRLAHSDLIWERRIAMIATFAFIKHGKSEPTFEIAEILIQDTHDFIQKAVGWMLREVGKRVSEEEEVAFLQSRYRSMPRTMLRYAIERFPEDKRKKYLEKGLSKKRI